MHPTSFLTTLALAFSLSTTVVSLGINCRGSGVCGARYCDSSGGMRAIQGYLRDAINRGDGGHHFNSGEHISCTGLCCAFFQTAGASGSTQDAYNHVTNLVNHGCKECGSDPTQPGNDVGKGQLTVNYVSNSGPNNCVDHYCGRN